MIDREALYSQLPATLQNVACSLEGWRIQRSRYSKEFWQALTAAEARSLVVSEEIRDFRDRRLQAFLQHSVDHVPFYRERFQRIGIDARDIRSLDDFAKLPVLTKAEVQQHQREIIAGNISERDCLIAHTSGTTGGGLRFASTLAAQREQWAIWWRYRRWHGIQFGEWCGYFGGRSIVPLKEDASPFWRYNYPARQILFSSYHLNSRNLPYYVSELRSRKPRWLHGYPSLLSLIASYLLDTGSELGYEVKWITTGAENLLPQQVQVIQRAFSCRPVQHYGMAEAVANISECPLGSMHVDEDFAAVEFVPADDGLSTKIVGTNLSNPAFPLLRYDVQDNIMVGARSCSCGRPGRVIERVDGRLEDYVVLTNGSKVGRLDHVFKDLVRIREAQIHQRRVGEIDVKVVRAQDYSDSDERALLTQLKQRIGGDMVVSIRYVDELQRTRSGKLRFVISDIEGAQIDSV